MAVVKDKQERDFRLYKNDSRATTTAADFNKIKVGNKVLQDDVVAIINNFNKRQYSNTAKTYTKEDVMRALSSFNLTELRAISKYFYETSGIYKNLCLYMSHLYKYDWFITPHIYDPKISDAKVIEGWYKASVFLENSRLKYNFGRIALDVLTEGVYYGYRIDDHEAAYLQKLPAAYCRSRYENNGIPAVEFNIKFFDDNFKDTEYRTKVLKMFPKEFQKAYIAYKKGTLPRDFTGDTAGWFLLDPEKAVKFNMNNSDAPLYIDVVPALLDLDLAQDIDRQKMAQQLVRLIIQQMPIDKNGDLVFDLDEVQVLHNNAVRMVEKVIGVDVLTTFADVKVADLSDNSSVNSQDQLEKVERTVYNNSGVAQMQFNTNKNTAMSYSVAQDGAVMQDLLLQFEWYAESLLKIFNKNPKRLHYSVQILPTTIHNFQKLSDAYKAQTMIGFSKLLPQVALGHTQSSIIATAIFENELLDLDSVFVAPQMSSTISSSDKDASTSSGGNSSGKGGRPEKAEDEKSEKTIANIESGG